jgi:adenylylsulfate kinase-like enzyme
MPRVLLVTGPSGAGKTATTTAFAASRSTPTAIVDQDLLRTFVKAGFVRPDTDWGPEAERQWQLSRTIGVDAMRRYLAEDFDVVIDTFAPGDDQQHWRAGVPDGVRFDVVVLRPSLDVAAERNGRRTTHVTDDASLVRNHEMFDYAPVPGAPVVDSTALSVDEVVAEIERLTGWAH